MPRERLNRTCAEQIARLAGYLKEESTEGGEYILRWADE